MFTLRKPTADAVDEFLAGQRSLPLSYITSGMTRGGAVAGYNVDRLRCQIGHGEAVFSHACEAIRAWVPHQQSWAAAMPRDVPPTTGGLVAIVARVGPWWTTNACRIVYTIDDEGPPQQFGFAYGTLASHVEQGEARFVVELDANEIVWYEILTHSRPFSWLAWLGYPLSRWYQRRFARGALAALALAVKAQ